MSFLKNNTNKEKYLMLFIFGGLTIAIISAFVFSHFFATPVRKKFVVPDHVSKEPKHVISDNTVTLVNNETVRVTVELSNGVTGSKYANDNLNLSGYIQNWRGTFLIRVSTTNNKFSQETLFIYEIPTQDFNSQSLVFEDTFSLQFADYNQDGNPDFSLGQKQELNSSIYNLYSINEKGEVYQLNPDVSIESSSTQPSMLFLHKNKTICCLSNEYLNVYTWDKDKLVHKKFSEYYQTQPNESESSYFGMDDYGFSIEIHNASFLSDIDPITRTRCYIDHNENTLRISIEKSSNQPFPLDGPPPDTIGPSIYYIYHYDTNTITELYDSGWTEIGLNLSDKRFIKISQHIKNAIADHLKKYEAEALLM